MRGRRRAVLIIPELTFNAGWADIAEKVARFLSLHKVAKNTEMSKPSVEEVSYAEAVRRSKWENKIGRGNKIEAVIKKEGIIRIKEPLCEYNEVLKRSLVGKFNAEATLSEVRRWSLSAWKHPYGLSVYEMGNNYFLFECSSRNQVEQIMEGTWEWKKIPVSLIWWNPLATTIEGS